MCDHFQTIKFSFKKYSKFALKSTTFYQCLICLISQCHHKHIYTSPPYQTQILFQQIQHQTTWSMLKSHGTVNIAEPSQIGIKFQPSYRFTPWLYDDTSSKAYSTYLFSLRSSLYLFRFRLHIFPQVCGSMLMPWHQALEHVEYFSSRAWFCQQFFVASQMFELHGSWIERNIIVMFRESFELDFFF